MKLVEVEESATPAAPPPPPARSAGSVSPPAVRRPAGPAAPARPNLGEVMKSVPPPKAVDEAALPAGAASGLGDIPDFAAIYKASGVAAPAHGFSAEKVLEIFSSPEFEPLEPRAKAAALMGFLKMNPSGPVPIAEVIQDALKRDQALDGFEGFLAKKLEQRRAQLDQENEGLQREIDEVTRRNKEKMDQNRRALDSEKERFATWQARKRIEERRLFDAVAPFVEENPVTLGAGAASPKPGA
jgi:hypothetical protein